VTGQLEQMHAYGEFEQSVIVEPGETTSVAVILRPRHGSQILETIGVHAHSYTLLDSSVEEVRDELFASLGALRGLPLEFVSANLGAIQLAAYQQLVSSPSMACRVDDADVELSLSGCDLSAVVRPDSRRTMQAFGGRAGLWKQGDGGTLARIDGRGGAFIDDALLVLGAASWFPIDGQGYPMLGAAAMLGHRGFVGAGWDFGAEAPRLVGQHDLTDRFYLAADLLAGGDDDRASEIALRYRVHSGYELQLISNLEGEVFAAVSAGL
jgi:hypothetical protein